MPETVASRSVPADSATVWDFVKDMDNWAHHVMGYQHHEVVDDRNSTWTLKGEAGVLARTVTFDVHIVEWVEPSCVTFTLTGVTEPMEGSGTFTVGTPALGPVPRPPRRGTLHRMVAAVLRWLTRRPTPSGAGPAMQRSGGAASTLTFSLRMQARGMTGPVVNAMIEPLLAAAADDLADQVCAAIGRRVP